MGEAVTAGRPATFGTGENAMNSVRTTEYGIDFGSLGMPGFDRQLTDKILAAFNHAYAVGDIQVARRLHAVLALAEDHERSQLLAAAGVEPSKTMCSRSLATVVSPIQIAVIVRRFVVT
jgi:hypothetical protein